MMNTVFLDFDGVLFDTIKEAYVICRYAYSNIDAFEPIEPDIYSLFCRYKFLVYNSGQYYYIMKLLNEGIREDNEFISRCKTFMKKRDIVSESEFDCRYCAKRAELMEKYPDFWDTLEMPFPFFYEVKKLFEDKKIDMVIVSRKNTHAVKKRLIRYGLELNNNKIYAKEELKMYPEKIDFIKEYMEKHQIQSAFFVDDNSNNLRPCKNYPPVFPLLAGWGNIAPDETGLDFDTVIKIITSTAAVKLP